jgi:hypothetical protein
MILLALIVLMVVQSTALNAQDATQNTVYLPVVASGEEETEQTDEQPTLSRQRTINDRTINGCACLLRIISNPRDCRAAGCL